VVFNLDPELALEDAAPMEAKVSAALAQRRFYALLLGAFAGVALALASAGVYGVVSYSVARQTRAIGVRRALGARQIHILAMVLGKGLILVSAGLVIGMAVAAGATRAVADLLFGVTTRDPLAYLAAGLSLAAVAALACYLPARRAARVDPADALRGVR
jgi:putative ABC transport system permease protein